MARQREHEAWSGGSSTLSEQSVLTEAGMVTKRLGHLGLEFHKLLHCKKHLCIQGKPHSQMLSIPSVTLNLAKSQPRSRLHKSGLDDRIILTIKIGPLIYWILKMFFLTVVKSSSSYLFPCLSPTHIHSSESCHYTCGCQCWGARGRVEKCVYIARNKRLLWS